MDSIKHNRAGKLAASMHRKASAPTEPIALAQHTPGPWRIVTDYESDPGRPFILGLLASEGGCNAWGTVAAAYGIDGEREANARLIAAAPEMLEALHGIDRARGPAGFAVAIEACRAAIAKATGGKS